MAMKMYFVLLASVIYFAAGVPVPSQEPGTRTGSVENNEFPHSLDIFKRAAQVNKGKNESLDSEGIFSKIIQGNKGSNLLLHEGDILLPKGRTAISCSSCLWPKSSLGTVNVPYVLSSIYNAQQIQLFKTAMQEFETLTCVRFIPRTTEADYVSILSSSGCASYIGKLGGPQQVSLSVDTCMLRGIIQHELSHVIGFVHEHSRSDRDNFITIVTKNIATGNLVNFDKYATNNLGLEYDYGSVMHYPRNAFTTYVGQDTIVPKPDPTVSIGQRYGLSVLDVSKINKLYNCNLCATLLNSMSGTFTSANYPSAYPQNSKCVWLIRTPAGQVALQFSAFDVQYSSLCSSDYMRIYDGPSKSSPVLLDRTCGTGYVPLMVSSSNQMLVEFVTDGATALTGFKAVYSAVQCGGAYYSSSKTFSTPGYPTSYYSNLDCGWVIAAPTGYKITLTMNDFAVESEPSCANDYLLVYDGQYTTAPIIGKKYCSSSPPPPLVSTGNIMLVLFHSNNVTEMRGFQAKYIMSLK
ncbi:embryonic protein UVS.2-like [Ranitomeya imitator]|uniref:embryonic protein UVS.2-like n=1 Tax=Ranitomeya imitator TaxID=111125 RepID=UPI0037E87D77